MSESASQIDATAGDRPRGPRRAWWGLALSVALAIGVNSGALRNGFAMDDETIVKRDEAIRSLRNIPELFARDFWDPKIDSGLYRPLVKTTLALNYAAGGLVPTGYHLVNLVLHGVVVGLLWLLFLQACGSRGLATAGASIFAVHAVHTEVTANIAFGRPETLSAAFVLAALLLYAKAEGTTRRARRLYAASLAFFALALLSKESAVTLVGIVALWDFALRTDSQQPVLRRVETALRRHGLRYAGYVAAFLAYWGVRRLALQGGIVLPPEISVDNPLFGLEPLWRTLNALWVAVHYGRLLVFPLHLVYDYSYDQIPTFQRFADPRAWVGIAAAIAVLGAWLWSLRRSPLAFFAIGFFLITFSLVSNVAIPIGTILGERLLYFPSIGFCLLLALIAQAVARTVARTPLQQVRLFVGLVVTIVCLHSARTVVRMADWESQDTLFVRDVERSPNSTKTHNNAGATLVKLDRFHEGLEHLRRAIEIMPYGYAVPWSTAGLAYTAIGRDNEALEMYEGALRNGTDQAAVFNNLGFLLVDRGIDVERGLKLIERAAEQFPRDPDVLDSLGWAYYKLGRYAEAVEKLSLAIEVAPEGPDVAARRDHLRLAEQALGRSASDPRPLVPPNAMPPALIPPSGGGP